MLHFARDDRHFEAMLRQMWRVLRAGRPVLRAAGEHDRHRADVTALGNGRFRLPDGSDRFLVDAAVIESWTRKLGGALLDPIKTTVVHEQRSMTTWVVRK